MELPIPVLAFKLLDSSGLTHHNRQLVLIGVDYTNKANLFLQMKNSLKKFHDEQAIPESNEKSTIKVVKPDVNESKDILYNRNNPRRWPPRSRGRGGRYSQNTQSRYA